MKSAFLSFIVMEFHCKLKKCINSGHRGRWYKVIIDLVNWHYVELAPQCTTSNVLCPGFCTSIRNTYILASKNNSNA